jgi:hypothetical protein
MSVCLSVQFSRSASREPVEAALTRCYSAPLHPFLHPSHGLPVGSAKSPSNAIALSWLDAQFPAVHWRLRLVRHVSQNTYYEAALLGDQPALATVYFAADGFAAQQQGAVRLAADTGIAHSRTTYKI